MTTVQDVTTRIRPEYEFNLQHVEKFLRGEGLDMGCGNCPLLRPNCLHLDISPQPLAVEQVGEENFVRCDCTKYRHPHKVDYIFSSHMVEDLPDEWAMIVCINEWGEMLKGGGHIVLLLPDMQGGRYPTVAEGGNPSHRIDVGREFVEGYGDFLVDLELVQIDTIAHEKSCTFDVVYRKMCV